MTTIYFYVIIGVKSMKYFNIRTAYGVETVDEINRSDFKSYSDYKNELRRLLSEYRLAGMDVYLSQRCTKDWKL